MDIQKTTRVHFTLYIAEDNRNNFHSDGNKSRQYALHYLLQGQKLSPGEKCEKRTVRLSYIALKTVVKSLVVTASTNRYGTMTIVGQTAI